MTLTELGGSCACPSPAVITRLCHHLCRVALSLGDRELKQGFCALLLLWPELDPGPAAVLLFTPALSSHLSVMTHLLTVFLVALLGLPVGKVDRG